MKSLDNFCTFATLDQTLNQVLIGSELGFLYITSLELDINTFNRFEKENDPFLKLITEKNRVTRLAKFNGKIIAISKINSKEFVIVCYSGDVVIYNLVTRKTNFISRGETDRDQISRLLIINQKMFVCGGISGILTLWAHRDQRWKKFNIQTFPRPIFCIDWISQKEFVTIDYEGNTSVSTLIRKNYIKTRRINPTLGMLQRAAIIDEKSFAIVEQSGRVFLFERENDSFRLGGALALSSANGQALKFHFSKLVCGTDREVIFIDPTTFEARYIKGIQCRQLRVIGDKLIILSRDNIIYTNENKAIDLKLHKTFRYAKIGLIGHTGVGKSSLCFFLKHRKAEGGKLKSSFGRKVWEINVGEGFNISGDQKILFYDVAGQESQLFTFFPNFADSNVILAVYKQTDRKTFDIALSNIKELKNYTSTPCKYFLIQNFKDDPHNTLEGFNFNECLLDYGIDDVIRISSKTGENLNDLVNRITKSIDWSRAPKIVQSKQFLAVSEQIMKLSDEDLDIKTISVSNFRKRLSTEVSERHLKYILTTLTNQGIIEFIPDIDRLVINDERFNALRSKIPERIRNNGGWYFKSKLIKDLSKNDPIIESYIYFHIKLLQDNLEAVLCNKGPKFRETVVIPRILKEEDVEISSEYLNLLPEKNIESFTTSAENFPWFFFLSAIKEYNLSIIEISQNSALLTNREDKFCFQIILGLEHRGRSKKLNVSLVTGGRSETLTTDIELKIKKMLLSLFTEVDSDEMEKFLEQKEGANENVNSTVKPTVYISYAHKDEIHGNWVHNLASNLQHNGVKCALDQWELYGGKQQVEFMKKINTVDKVIIICEPNLVRKLMENKASGINFEFVELNKRLLSDTKEQNSIIPILKEGLPENALPEELKNYCIYIDFRSEDLYQESLKKLIKAIWDQPDRLPPPLGSIPKYIETT